MLAFATAVAFMSLWHDYVSPILVNIPVLDPTKRSALVDCIPVGGHHRDRFDGHPNFNALARFRVVPGD
jgi:hypothetical protein